ncbi:GWxTD domain-containing protein [Hymenobacter weizhouensis]|uniref:GWxTD domain-containing protein n=1 Tax=Hymenobacter sp. YIM 151500-1 TaxID=2987689 RepID=UPI002227A118|nr:GWxTD domain-containing protein [Hymenobacter sp. YIM 151500-1]UYZ63065.1 GWxTD domain-containing protein [Hymenobacter sp. YIM 151500-1]
MKPIAASLLFLCLLSLSGNTFRAPSRRDFASLYRPERRVLLDTRRENDSLRVYLRLPARRAQASGTLHVAAWPSYDARQPLWRQAMPVASRRRGEGESAWLEVGMALNQLRPGQVLSFQTDAAPEDDTAGEGAWLQLTPEHLARPFLLTDTLGQPLFRRYVRTREAFGVDCYGPDQPVQARRYPLSSQAAAPPMAGTLPAQPRTLSLQDSVWHRAGQPLRLAAGLYLLRTAQGSRQGLLVEENNFPEQTTADELIAPLIYLTSSAERKKLFDAPEPKKAVDRFWLDVAGGNQTIGRQLIRTYYGRVTEANRLFTAHKAGWLTDRGMLYLVLGPPESVYRTAQEERWVYRGGQDQAGTFVFRPKPSTFAPEHYELVRRPEYERLWYAAVEQWRKGLIAQAGR